jgi:hypothetical protein
MLIEPLMGLALRLWAIWHLGKYFTSAGYSSGPRKHGEFPEYEFWNPDFWCTTDPPKFYRHYGSSYQYSVVSGSVFSLE